MNVSREVFVSYSQPDKACAHSIVTVLESRGLGVWVAPRDVSPAADWAAAIVDAIAAARLMVIILSDHSNDSPQVRREVERAVHRNIPVLPFRIQDITPSKSLEYFLSSQHWLDAFPGRFELYIDRLADHCVRMLEVAHGSDVQSTAAAMSKPRLILESAQRQAFESQLALYVGPIANVLVSRAAARVPNAKGLVDALAAEIDSEKDRQLFVLACGREFKSE